MPTSRFVVQRDQAVTFGHRPVPEDAKPRHPRNVVANPHHLCVQVRIGLEIQPFAALCSAIPRIFGVSGLRSCLWMRFLDLGGGAGRFRGRASVAILSPKRSGAEIVIVTCSVVIRGP